MVQEYLNLDFAPLQSWPLIEHELHLVANVVKNGKVISVKTLRRVRPGLFVYQRLRGRVEISDTRRIEVQPGQTTSLSLVPSPSLLTVVASTASTVIIDGQQVGETPLTNHPIALGTRDIIVRSAAGEERRFTRTVTVAPVSIDVNF